MIFGKGVQVTLGECAGGEGVQVVFGEGVMCFL